MIRTSSAAPSRPWIPKVRRPAVLSHVAPIEVRRFYPGGSDTGVVFFHGGGWMYGDLDMADSFCRFLTRMSGATVMSVDYHLAPEHRYPAALDDAVIAIQWLMAKAHEYAIDPAKLVVCGSSAGGNLAAAACLKLRDQQAALPSLQVLLCPALDATMTAPSYDEHSSSGFLTRADMAHYWSAYLGDTDPSDPYASPLAAADLSGLPPALIVTAGADPLRDDGERYADRLREAGVDADCSALRRPPSALPDDLRNVPPTVVIDYRDWHVPAGACA